MIIEIKKNIHCQETEEVIFGIRLHVYYFQKSLIWNQVYFQGGFYRS